jgi:hypothetical protein
MAFLKASRSGGEYACGWTPAPVAAGLRVPFPTVVRRERARNNLLSQGDFMFLRVRFLIVVILWAVLPSAAAAQGLGPRAGASVNPDQFYFGGHVETSPLVGELRFRPNVEVGLGEEATVVAINVEFAYFFPPSDGGWSLFAGGGPALNVIDTKVTESSSEGGFNLLAGVSHEGGLFGEVKVGFLDSPNFKVGVGYTFRWR